VRRVERLREGRKYGAAEPLFPRYLFIRLDCINDNWYPIRSTRGVNQIVRCRDRPLPVRDEIVEGIRARLAGPIGQEPYLKPGERVLIMEGPFSQIEAIFLATMARASGAPDEHSADGSRVSFPLESVKKVG
jgi:Transcription antiterminator